MFRLPLITGLKEKLLGKVPKGRKRSSKWPKVRATHLKANPLCAVCGGSKKTEVHHIQPFHTAPDLELEPTNLLTLCEAKKYGLTCHLFVGHLGNYSHGNPNVKQDAEYLRGRLLYAKGAG